MPPRYYYSKKSTIEHYSKSLSIFDIKKDSALIQWASTNAVISWSRNGQIFARIGVTITLWELEGSVAIYLPNPNRESDENPKPDYKIRLVATRCNLWGLRWWFICPCKGNRCAKLYMQSNGVFASRETLNLSYESRNHSRLERYYKALFWPNNPEVYELYKSIKYPYRNWKPTRKMKRYLKLSYSPYTLEEQARREAMIFAE